MFLKDGMIITFNVDIMRVNKITYGENRKKKNNNNYRSCPLGRMRLSFLPERHDKSKERNERTKEITLNI